MPEWLSEVQHLERNFAFGVVGALLVVLYQIHRALPDIQAHVSVPLTTRPSVRTGISVFAVLLMRVIVSVFGAALVASLLVRPEQGYGAIVAGMTWTVTVRTLLDR